MENPTSIESKDVSAANPSQEVWQPTKLDKIVEAVADLTTEEAALSRLDELLIEEVENAFEIGAVLSKMKDEKWFSGHMSFEEFCKARYGFSRSRAYKLLAIYRVLNKLQIPWDDVKKVGSAKLHLLCARAISKKFDPDDFSAHVESAKSKTFLELKSDLQGASPKGSNTKAKDDGKSEHAAAATEPNDDQPVGQFPEDETADAEPEATGDDSTNSGADAVQTSTKAVPNESLESDPDADSKSSVITYLRKIKKDAAFGLYCEAFPGYSLIEEKD